MARFGLSSLPAYGKSPALTLCALHRIQGSNHFNRVRCNMVTLCIKEESFKSPSRSLLPSACEDSSYNDDKLPSKNVDLMISANFSDNAFWSVMLDGFGRDPGIFKRKFADLFMPTCWNFKWAAKTLSFVNVKGNEKVFLGQRSRFLLCIFHLNFTKVRLLQLLLRKQRGFLSIWPVSVRTLNIPRLSHYNHML